ncbi:hypothetical protein [Poseidonocella sp. HB161398]|uniref:hypothetical protein n=1 Tax=Poseidonocella sp. HB161398 TaxID=2320855 RepID=UPI001109CCB8|nr:hypothetical protein [Poseidonocella sp. HB161398]
MRNVLAASAFLGAVLAAGVAAASEGGWSSALSAFAGRMTWGDYGTIAYAPGSIDWAESRLYGLAYSRDRALGGHGVRIGWEAQLVAHEGVSNHVAVNLPATIRYRAADPVLPWQGAAFGLGASFASEAPELEKERKGQSQQVLPYWFMELEFGKPSWEVAPFLRIHHRSDGFIFAPFDTGSNAVVLGLRHAF